MEHLLDEFSSFQLAGFTLYLAIFGVVFRPGEDKLEILRQVSCKVIILKSDKSRERRLVIDGEYVEVSDMSKSQRRAQRDWEN